VKENTSWSVRLLFFFDFRRFGRLQTNWYSRYLLGYLPIEVAHVTSFVSVTSKFLHDCYDVNKIDISPISSLDNQQQRTKCNPTKILPPDISKKSFISTVPYYHLENGKVT
jgi:hypothetical protein